MSARLKTSPNVFPPGSFNLEAAAGAAAITPNIWGWEIAARGEELVEHSGLQ